MSCATWEAAVPENDILVTPEVEEEDSSSEPSNVPQLESTNPVSVSAHPPAEKQPIQTRYLPVSVSGNWHRQQTTSC